MLKMEVQYRMKLLYIAPTRIDMTMLDGVAKKITGHVKVFANNYDTFLIYRDKENVMLYHVNESKFVRIRAGKNKVDILNAALALIEKEKYDFCYIRYPNSDPLFLKVLKQLKRKGVRIVIEIPTYPYDEEGKESIKGRVVHYIDVHYRKKLHHYVDRIVTYSKDNFIFNIKTIKTVNGVDFERVSESHFLMDNSIHMCGVATFHQIHGYDRLIKGLNLYYKNGGDKNIVFDVVGYGDNSILQEYKEMVKSYHLEDRVIFHGRLNGLDLDEMYDNAVIGVNSLAIHRQNLEFESTLKTREYAAKGLIILSSSYIDAFNEDDNLRYVCRVPADDTPIDIKQVIDFYENLYQDNNIEILRNQIRNSAKAVCDMPVTLNPVIDFFNA